jgi:hypothetical protein
VWYQNREFTGSDSLHRTVTVMWNTRTSHAECIPPIQSSGCMAAWNPSKLSCHSSQVKCFFCIFFRFLLLLVSKITWPIWYKWIIYKKITNKILIFGIKKIILILILPSCSVILPNPLRNIIICSIPLKFCLAVKIYKKKIFTNFIKVNKLI